MKEQSSENNMDSDGVMSQSSEDEGEMKDDKGKQERGLANVMGKILQKSIPGNKVAILSKASTDKVRTAAQKRKQELQDETVSKKEKTEASDGRSSDSDDDDLGPNQKVNTSKYIILSYCSNTI